MSPSDSPDNPGSILYPSGPSEVPYSANKSLVRNFFFAVSYSKPALAVVCMAASQRRPFTTQRCCSSTLEQQRLLGLAGPSILGYVYQSQITPTMYFENIERRGKTFGQCRCYDAFKVQVFFSALPFNCSVCYYGQNQLTNSTTHNSVTVFFVLGKSFSFTQVTNGFEHGLEAHFSTFIIDYCSRPPSHQNQAQH